MTAARGIELAVLLGAIAASGGCQLVAGFEDFTGTGGAGGGGVACGKPQGDGGASMVSQERPDGGCFWIDETEVTVDAYEKFRAGAQTPDQPVPCDGNKSFDPDSACLGGLSAPPAGEQPVVCVDWCDADAYCTSVGKRLCAGDYLQVAAGEWYAACSNGGASLYPYGQSYQSGACNAACTSASCAETVPSSSLGSCKAACGAFDMSGNVAEWVDECNGATCMVRGGGVNDGANALTCEGAVPVDLLTVDKFRGFRCCSDPG